MTEKITHVAAIATAADLTDGVTCDLMVNEAVIATYDLRDGIETPVYEMGPVNVLAQGLGVRLDDEDKIAKAIAAANDALAAHGFARVDDWEIAAGAVYASLTRDAD